MSDRFSQVIPKNPSELEQFYIRVIEKLRGTSATLEDIDNRGSASVGSLVSDIESAVRELINSAVSPLKAQVSELEQQIRNQQLQSISIVSEFERQIRNQQGYSANIVSELERRINSIEVSARF